MFLSDEQIRESNSSRDGTNGQGLITGSGGKTNAKFYMHAVLDGDATQAAGRPIYCEEEYVLLWAEGSKDSASNRVTPDNKRDHPQAWAEFVAQRQNPIHPVQFLPGFSAAHRRYCEDAELFTVEALVNATVQPELQGLQDMGRRWLELLAEPKALAVVGPDPIVALPSPEAAIPTREELAATLARLMAEQQPKKKRGGRVKGSRNKPKAAPDVQNA